MLTVKQCEKYTADYIHGNGALVVLEIFKIFRGNPHSRVETVEGRSTLCQCFDRGVMGQVKLLDFNNASTSAFGLDSCFASLTLGYRTNSDDDFLGLQADEMVDSFFTETYIRAGDDDGLARETQGSLAYGRAVCRCRGACPC